MLSHKQYQPIEFFNRLFGNLTFTKIREQNFYSMYYAKISSLTQDGTKYVILLCPFNQSFVQQGNIRQIQWVSLQTRTLQEDLPIPEQYIDPKVLDPRYYDIKQSLNVKNRNFSQTTYWCTLPVEVCLLHNQKNKTIYQFADQLDLLRALATYQCVVKKLQ